jgi:hypothetical protein
MFAHLVVGGEIHISQNVGVGTVVYHRGLATLRAFFATAATVTR